MLYKGNIVYEGARGSRRKRKYMTSEQIESHLKSHGKHIKKLQEKVKELSKSTNLKKRVEELEDKTEDIPDN
jgi:predicted nuclease with TOPRIM domain